METTATYRRRRIGALFVIVMLVVTLYAIRGAGAEPTPTYYTVAQDDTVWSIVVAHYPPQKDPRPRVEDISEANNLSGFRIHPGQRLELPAAD